ncbi:hypothetical protein NAV26_03380 [Pseudomonas stutzeri]|uniref:hypothetical protein n=1 Tax=Pseudomonadaceae TaxID=135621 RepID=UPI000FFC6912|nr:MULTISPECIES: hypothetical protein [Pseudomonadaceae]MCQ4324005.1 hypothetical protein [Stutzerimonas stutzeri]
MKEPRFGGVFYAQHFSTNAQGAVATSSASRKRTRSCERIGFPADKEKPGQGRVFLAAEFSGY